MVDYQSALEKPFTDIKKLLIGIILSILPIINWFAIGFYIKCSGVGKTKPSNKMPEWKNFGDLFTKGFISVAICLIYLLPALIFAILSIGPLIISFLKSIPAEQLATQAPEKAAEILQPLLQNMIPSILAVIPFIIITVLLLLLALYVYPMAILSYLEKERFADAFKFGKIFKKAFTGKYFVACLVLILVLWVLSLLDYIPWVGMPAVRFILGVITYSLFGQIYLNKEVKKEKLKIKRKR